jgi:hypothetical protein
MDFPVCYYFALCRVAHRLAAHFGAVEVAIEISPQLQSFRDDVADLCANGRLTLVDELAALIAWCNQREHDLRKNVDSLVQPKADNSDYMPAKKAADCLAIDLPRLSQLCDRDKLLRSRKPTKEQKVGRERRQVLLEDVLKLKYKWDTRAAQFDGAGEQDAEGVEKRIEAERLKKQKERERGRTNGR